VSQRRCCRFACLTPCHKDRERYPFQLRDGDAAAFLIEALVARGYRYGGPILKLSRVGAGRYVGRRQLHA